MKVNQRNLILMSIIFIIVVYLENSQKVLSNAYPKFVVLHDRQQVVGIVQP